MLPPLEEQRRVLTVSEASNAVVEAASGLVLDAERLELSIVDFVVDRWMATGPIVPAEEVLQGSPESGCSAPESSSPTGHFVLALSALHRGGYRLGELKPVHPSKAMSRAKLEDGDLLISRSNTPDRVGYVGIYRQETEDCVSFPDTMMRLRPGSELVGSAALEMMLQASAQRRQIMSIAAGTSSSMQKINKQNLLRLRLPLPTPAAQESGLELRIAGRQAVVAAREREEAALRLHLATLNQVTGG